MELVKLKPTVKDYIWGGNYFQSFNKGLVPRRSRLLNPLRHSRGDYCRGDLPPSRVGRLR